MNETIYSVNNCGFSSFIACILALISQVG